MSTPIISLCEFKINFIFLRNLLSRWGKWRVAFILRILWRLEYKFFYPKLKNALLDLNLLELQSNSKTDPIIFDVGANIGQSIDFYRSIYPSSLIHSFEPLTDVFRILTEKSSDRTFCYNLGLSDYTGVAVFYESIFHEGSSLVAPVSNSRYNMLKAAILGVRTSEMYQKTEISVSTIDETILKLSINQIMVLKIDTEGSEFEVLRGAESSLSKKVFLCIQIESHQDDLRPNNSQEIDRYLESFGYAKVKSIRHPFGNFFEYLYMNVSVK